MDEEIEKLEKHLKTAAFIVKNHGSKFLPVFQHYQKRLKEARQAQEDLNTALDM